MSIRRFVPLLTLALGMVLLMPVPEAYAQQTAFRKVKVRSNRNDKDRRLVDKDADLFFDDAARKLTVKSAEWPLDVSYDDIQNVTFEVTTHMRGGAMSQIIGGVAGAIIASEHVNDYWFYLSYKAPNREPRSYMIEVSSDSSKDVIAKAQSVFGDKVAIASFPEKADKIEKDSLKDLQSKHDLKVDKKNHPVPEVQVDKALVVVVCPPLAARYAGKGTQFKLHANDRVVAVNKMGTYAFAYLEPGEYTLVSQSDNASGMRIKLEAGRDYYFLQNTFTGFWKPATSLSRNTRELAMHELNGAYYADWKRK